MRIDHHKLPNYMDMRGGYEYNQTENPYIQESPVFTGALVYCHTDWMLTIGNTRVTEYLRLCKLVGQNEKGDDIYDDDTFVSIKNNV